jgi:predicted transcriptional regulator
MQLNRLVNFHKTLGDKTRLRIIALLKEGPLHGQAIAEKLGLKPPTISHHIAKLRDIDLIYQRRDKNTIYFYLHEKKLMQMAQAIVLLGSEDMFGAIEVDEEVKQKVIGNFLLANGRLKTLPAQRKKKLIMLEYMTKGLRTGKVYTEEDINNHIQQFYDDYATVRREWVMSHFMFRENGKYELNPREMWPV